MQVYDFVKLGELFYAGSHGMDIKGPNKVTKHTKAQVYTSFFFPLIKAIVHFYLYQVLFSLVFQAKAVLCQPASEFLPMIDEVGTICIQCS